MSPLVITYFPFIVGDGGVIILPLGFLSLAVSLGKMWTSRCVS